MDSGSIYLQNDKYGYVEVSYDGAEGIAFWLVFDDGLDGDSWYRFTFEEADKIRDFLNYWFPKEES